jgi:transcriptional regulator with XRE-family HTH domain
MLAMDQTPWEPKLGHAIRRQRIKRRLTQQAAADLYGCSLRWWQVLEQGRNVSVDVLLKIAKLLKVKPWQLLKWGK